MQDRALNDYIHPVLQPVLRGSPNRPPIPQQIGRRPGREHEFQSLRQRSLVAPPNSLRIHRKRSHAKLREAAIAPDCSVTLLQESSKGIEKTAVARLDWRNPFATPIVFGVWGVDT